MSARLWLNGALVPAAAARLDPADRGFLLGDGVFETIAVRDGRAWHLPAHLARMAAGMAVLGLSCPWDIAAEAEAYLDAMRPDAAVLRITLSRGVAARGLWPGEMTRPSLVMQLSAPPPAPRPIRIVVCERTQRNQNSPLSRIKSLNYLDNILARAEAVARGAKDALLCNTSGDLACASAATLLVAVGDDWLTPRLADGALPGITRGLLIRAGLVREARLTVATLSQAKRIILANSLGLTPVEALAARAIGIDGEALARMTEATRGDARRRDGGPE